MTAILVTAAGLALPSLLTRFSLPCLDHEQMRAVFGMQAKLPSTFTLGGLLLVPWLSAAAFLALVAWLVPPWRTGRRSALTERRLARASWIMGALAMASMVLGLTMFLESGHYLVNDSWAPWGVAAAMAAVSVGARQMAEVVNRWGVGDGISVLMAGELLQQFAENIHDEQTEWWRNVSEQGSEQVLPFALSIAALLALGLVLSGSISLRHRIAARWSAVPMTMLVGLVPIGLAVVVLGALQDPTRAYLYGDALLSLPLHPRPPAESELSLALTAVCSVAVALMTAPPRRAFELLARAGVRIDDSRTWYWLAVFLNGCWLLLLLHAAQVSMLGKGLAQACLVLLALRDIAREWRLRGGTQVAALCALHGPTEAVAVRHVLSNEGIPHTLRGEGVRALLQGVAPLSPLLVMVPEHEVGRARALLSPVLSSLSGQAVRPAPSVASAPAQSHTH